MERILIDLISVISVVFTESHLRSKIKLTLDRGEVISLSHRFLVPFYGVDFLLRSLNILWVDVQCSAMLKVQSHQIVHFILGFVNLNQYFL